MWSLVGTDKFQLEDRYGTVKELTDFNVWSMFGFAWALQLIGFIMLIAYYGTHPAEVSLKLNKQKLKIDILGETWDSEKVCTKEDQSEELRRALPFLTYITAL